MEEGAGWVTPAKRAAYRTVSRCSPTVAFSSSMLGARSASHSASDTVTRESAARFAAAHSRSVASTGFFASGGCFLMPAFWTLLLDAASPAAPSLRMPGLSDCIVAAYLDERGL